MTYLDTMKTEFIQLTTRLPEDLHRSIKDLAKREERSLNNMLIRLLREALEGKDSYTRPHSFYITD